MFGGKSGKQILDTRVTLGWVICGAYAVWDRMQVRKTSMDSLSTADVPKLVKPSDSKRELNIRNQIFCWRNSSVVQQVSFSVFGCIPLSL